MKGLPRVMTVEEIGGLDQLRLGVGAVGMENPILNIAIGCHDNQQHPPLREPQELDLAERRLAASRGRNNAGEASELREQLSGIADQPLRTVGTQMVLQFADLAFAQRLNYEQRIDEKAIPLRRRNPARGSMRAGDETHLLEIRHDVADGGGRQFQPGLA